MKTGEMLLVLSNTMQMLPDLLAQDEGWNSLEVTYESPRVERLWRQADDIRIMLHRIHPCESPLFHPHPWPSAVYVLAGSYEMNLGHGSDKLAPPVTETFQLSAGSRYEMIDVNAWHSVRPIGSPSLSVMVTGKPWDRWSPCARRARSLAFARQAGKSSSHAKLHAETERELLNAFRKAILIRMGWVELQDGWILTADDSEVNLVTALRRAATMGGIG